MKLNAVVMFTGAVPNLFTLFLQSLAGRTVALSVLIFSGGDTLPLEMEDRLAEAPRPDCSQTVHFLHRPCDLTETFLPYLNAAAQFLDHHNQ